MSIAKMDLSNLASVMFNDEVNDTQIFYHLVYPKYFNLIKKQKRPPTSGQATAKKRRRRGRPRKEEVQQSDEVRRAPEENAGDDKPDENVVQLACSRTRSGRVSRPPKHMSKFIDSRVSTTTDANTVPMDSSEPQSKFNIEPLSDTTKPVKITPEPRKIRKNIARFTCSVCKKVYLGRKKMLKHYLTFPDHKTPDSLLHPPNQFTTNGRMVNGTNSFLFDELMKLVGESTQTERISIFLAEISNFVSKIHMFKPKILHTEQVSQPSTSEYYLDKNASKLLDLPEGMHQLNDRAFDDQFQQNNNTFSTYIDERPTTDISPLNNLQPLGYNLNLFPQVNYDQISDNAVEAEALGNSNGNDTISDLPHETPILDIPLDLFSFNGIK